MTGSYIDEHSGALVLRIGTPNPDDQPWTREIHNEFEKYATNCEKMASYYLSRSKFNDKWNDATLWMSVFNLVGMIVLGVVIYTSRYDVAVMAILVIAFAGTSFVLRSADYFQRFAVKKTIFEVVSGEYTKIAQSVRYELLEKTQKPIKFIQEMRLREGEVKANILSKGISTTQDVKPINLVSALGVI